MEEVKRGRGRPTVGERVPLGLRVTPDLKQRLDAAAEQSGRSQSQEAELRLERSFERGDLIAEVLTLAYGSKETAGLVMMLGSIMDTVGRLHMDTNRRRYFAFNYAHWTEDPDAFDQAAQGVSALLSAAYPSRSTKHRRKAQTAPHGRNLAREMIRALRRNDGRTS